MKKYVSNSNNLFVGDDSNLESPFEPSQFEKDIPIDFKQIEDIQNNSEFAIDDNEEDKIEIYKRITRYKKEITEYAMNFLEKN